MFSEQGLVLICKGDPPSHGLARRAGVLEDCRAGELESWGAGELESLRAGELGSWGAGELESWRAGELESWRAGEPESWRPREFVSSKLAASRSILRFLMDCVAHSFFCEMFCFSLLCVEGK